MKVNVELCQGGIKNVSNFKILVRFEIEVKDDSGLFGGVHYYHGSIKRCYLYNHPEYHEGQNTG